MTPVDAYKCQQVNRWTRIELLLELYNATIAVLDRAQSAEARGDEQVATRELIEAQRLVAGLVSAITPEAGELSDRLGHLYLFVVQCIGARDVEPAVRILSILREGFEGIRAQAIELEGAGQVPAMQAGCTLQVDA